MNNSTAREKFAQSIPEFERMVRSQFRDHGQEAREELVQNALALAWKYFHRLVQQGRGSEQIMRSVLWYAVKQTRCGRSVSGCPKAKDAMDQRAKRVVFEHCELGDFVSKTTPPDQAASFRLDIPEFIATLTERQQKMADGLMAGGTTAEVAKQIGVTASSVSQFRRRFKDLYDGYFGE